MPRDLPVGNGNILVAFDKDYLLREFYFPFPGEENHTKGEVFHFGVWVNGKFSWVPSGWTISKEYLNESLITNVSLVNNDLGIQIRANDLVDFHENIYLKKLEIENLSDQEKEVRLFQGQDFHIYGTEIGDTAAYRPEVHSLLHYKHDRYFLINIYANNKFGIDHYATGNKETGVYEGTWRDAEDGILSKNPIAQGSVDSVLAIHYLLPPKGKEVCYYWICAGKNWEDVFELNEIVKKKTPAVIFKRTLDYWKLWVNKEDLQDGHLPQKVWNLYKKSLLICRTQINNTGAIIAGNDSDVVLFNRDTYSYMWPRDASLGAYALDLAGYSEITRKFFTFCSKIITKEGYFLHKYTACGTLASSWHPWERSNKPQLPIQEDETALVIWALWNHFKLFKDVEYIKQLYRPLIIRAADFMMDYRDYKTGLPLLSFDLWEERQGILTFTVSAVYGGLIAASNFAEIFGEKNLADEYREGARMMREAMDKRLYLENEKRFARGLIPKNGGYEVDKTIDASLFGIFAFGAYSPEDEKVKNTMQQIEGSLWVKTPVGGLARYENDGYYRTSDAHPNPWFVTTLWLAQYYIAISKNEEDLKKALRLLEWTADHALPSGVLAEQVNPHTHEPLSVSPLTWSHTTFIAAVEEYLNKLQELNICANCGRSIYRKRKE
ncbi:MAG TPA: glycoside hydrolase family 15 protein [Chlamydiales bacterium]|nr:glycoside hydrolase family 15 protein [Chlamydiales bacterium]